MDNANTLSHPSCSLMRGVLGKIKDLNKIEYGTTSSLQKATQHPEPYMQYAKGTLLGLTT